MVTEIFLKYYRIFLTFNPNQAGGQICPAEIKRNSLEQNVGNNSINIAFTISVPATGTGVLITSNRNQQARYDHPNSTFPQCFSKSVCTSSGIVSIVLVEDNCSHIWFDSIVKFWKMLKEFCFKHKIPLTWLDFY